MFPDQLWLPTLRDQISDFAPRQVLLKINVASAATTVDATTGTPPPDKVWLVTHVFGRSNATSPQLTNTVRLGIRDAAQDVLICVLDEFEDLTGIDRVFLRSDSPFVLMNGQIIELASVFDAGASNNVSDLSVLGTEIPRGNWQR